MNRIVIDAELAAKIYQFTGPVQLVDATGRVVADIEPRVDPAEYALLEDPFTEEEIEERCAPGRKTYTTEELLAKLREPTVNPEWDDKASDELADIWVAATPDERDEIERAVLGINHELADDPANKGNRGAGAPVR